jgi:hypothetical protein
MTTFALLCNRCGLSLREAADFLGVRQDTVRSWSIGRRGAPASAIEELRALYAKIERAAGEAVAMARKARGATIELGIAADDHEARSLGWPCVGAQAASLGLVAARLGASVVIVPRGSTGATAAAADIHETR